jgi:hypothetical protein
MGTGRRLNEEDAVSGDHQGTASKKRRAESINGSVPSFFFIISEASNWN